jgi:Pyridoxamine 5'-phosphate oxidase
MPAMEPVTKLDPRYSSAGAAPTGWPEARKRLEEAEVFWVSTVRPDGRPHVTPVIAVGLEGTLYFCTGENERKAKNLERNPHCILTTGCNRLGEGLDLVMEGDAARVLDDERLGQIARAYVAKYGPDWRFTVRDGQFFHAGAGEGAGPVLVFELTPARGFGFRKGEEYSQTRWVF